MIEILQFWSGAASDFVISLEILFCLKFLSPRPKYIFESARVRSDENINTRKILSRDYQACTAGRSSAIFYRRCLFVSQEFVSSFLTLEVVYCKEFGRLPVAPDVLASSGRPKS